MVGLMGRASAGAVTPFGQSAETRRHHPSTPEAKPVRTVQHWIAGKTTSGTADRSAPVFNPATGQQQAEVLLGSAERRRVRDRRGQGRVR